MKGYFLLKKKKFIHKGKTKVIEQSFNIKNQVLNLKYYSYSFFLN